MEQIWFTSLSTQDIHIKLQHFMIIVQNNMQYV